MLNNYNQQPVYLYVLLLGWLLCSLLVSFDAFCAQGDPTLGRKLSAVCVACHAIDGNSTTSIWPKIAGQHTSYIEKQLHDFKSGLRENIQMSGFVKTLSAEDIMHLAAYFAQQKQKISVASDSSVELGNQLYRAGDKKQGIPACIACHGPRGRGNPAAGYPVISGQHAEYTSIQLKAFKAEQRHNDKNAVMRSISRNMTNKQIEVIANYLQGLH